MDKINLKISVRHGMSEKFIQEIEIEKNMWKEGVNLRDLKVYKDDCYLTFSFEEVEEEKSED